MEVALIYSPCQDPDLKCDFLDPEMPLPDAEVEAGGETWRIHLASEVLMR